MKKGKDEIFHSPLYYYHKCKDEDLPHALSVMLENDCADDYDPIARDIENISNYQERWDSKEFVMYWGEKLYEIYLQDLRIVDLAAYKKTIGEITSEEEHYDKLIDKIARDILNGSEKLLLQNLKQIRKNDESGGAYNKQKKSRSSLQTATFSKYTEALKEKNNLFTYKEAGGCNEDWQKEINHHSVVITMLEGVKEKMKQIIDIEKNIINKTMAIHTERLNELLTKTSNRVQEEWINRITLMTIEGQNNYQKNKAIVHKEFLENEKENQISKEDIKTILNKNIKKDELHGFE